MGEAEVRIPPLTAGKFRLLMQGLEHLRQDLLDEAAEIASKKLSRKDGGLFGMLAEGQKHLAQIEAINQLYDELAALGLKAGVPEVDGTSY